MVLTRVDRVAAIRLRLEFRRHSNVTCARFSSHCKECSTCTVVIFVTCLVEPKVWRDLWTMISLAALGILFPREWLLGTSVRVKSTRSSGQFWSIRQIVRLQPTADLALAAHAVVLTGMLHIFEWVVCVWRLRLVCKALCARAGKQ